MAHAHRGPLAALASLALTLTLAPSADAQQRLLAVGRGDIMWEYLDHDTAQPSLLRLATLGHAPGSQLPGGGSVGAIASERGTDDLFVLKTNWGLWDDTAAEIWRTDPDTGDSQLLLQFEAPDGPPFGRFRGLAQRPDGTLVTLYQGSETHSSIHADSTHLTLIDLQRGHVDHMPLLGPTGPLQEEFFVAFTLDERGSPVGIGSTSAAIDPVHGFVSNGPVTGPGLLHPWGLALANDGTYLAGDTRGNLFTYDPVAGNWTETFGDGVLGPNYLYGFALTGVEHGSDFGAVCQGAPNSTGRPSTLEFIGSSTAADQDLQLVARHVPAGSFGLYVMGSAAGSTPVGAGTLCIGGTAHRDSSPVAFSGFPAAKPLDLSQLFDGQPALAGSRRIFQLWHRDVGPAGPTSNLSDAVSVDFE